VGDTKHATVREPIGATAYLPIFQTEEEGGRSNGMYFYVRTQQTPESAESVIRQSIHSIDSKLALDDFRTTQEQINETLTDERVMAFLASCFGVLAGFMAAIGIYGVLAYATAQRTREFGIRMALGATPSKVLGMVVTGVAWLASIGIAAGIPLSLTFGHIVGNQLYGVSQSDPVTFLFASLSVLALSLAAAALPARRAARVDPMVALRYE
jgi:putative ABC transport system permease protein